MAGQFSISPNTRSTFNNDGAVLLNVNTGAVYCLSAVGAQIWRLLDENQQGLTFDAIFKALMPEGGVSPQRLLVDLDFFLTDLEARGLVHKIEAAQTNSYAVN